MGRSRYKVLENRPHFVTCTTVNWIPIFSYPEFAQIILNSLSFLYSQDRLILQGYVLMENHLHLIGTAENLSKEIRTFKSFTARSIIDQLKLNQSYSLLNQLKSAKLPHKTDQEYQLWQEGFHPQAILSEEMLLQKLEYIHNNPVKRGYIDEPVHWRYSSYRNYQGLSGLIPIEIIS